MPDVPAHPSARALALFGQGKLPEAQAATVAAHLEVCAACRRAAAGPPPGAARTAVQSPAAPPAPAASSVPPELLQHPKFRVLRELGRGGMGVVYLAQHRVMNRPVAIKVISDSLLADGDAAARLQAEVRAAARLDHQNIVRAFDAERVGSLHLLIMEFVNGPDLATLLKRSGPLPPADACRYAHQAALGLQHAFERGMVHRDIKPQNLVLTPEGRVKILDFGIARVRSERAGGTRLTLHESLPGARSVTSPPPHGSERSRLTRQDVFIGTPDYVAPEQAIDAREADTRADIYSLGCTLYALLAGRPPFVGESAAQVVLAHIEHEPRPLPELRPDVPTDLGAVVTKMMAKDPDRRYQTPLEAVRALAGFCRVDSRPRSGAISSPAAVVPPAGIVSVDGGERVPPPPRRAPGPAQGPARQALDADARPHADPEPATSLPVPATAEEQLACPRTLLDAEWEGEVQRSKARLFLIAGGVVGSVVAGLLLVLALSGGGSAPRPRSKPGEKPADLSWLREPTDGQGGRSPPAAGRKGTSQAEQHDIGSELPERAASGGKPAPPPENPTIGDDGRGDLKWPRPVPPQPHRPAGGDKGSQGAAPSRGPDLPDKAAEDDRESTQQVAGLLRQLDKSSAFSEEARIAALKSLGKLGPRVKDKAGKAVAQCMVDPSGDVGRAARDALEKIDPAVVKECTAIIRDRDNELRLRSIQTLASLGKDGSSATPILMDVVEKVVGSRVRVPEPSKVAAAAIQALLAIGSDDERLPRRLVKWMEVPDEQVQLACIAGVTRVRWQSKDDKQAAVMSLRKELRAGNRPTVQAAAADALGDFGSDAKAAVEALKVAKGDPAAAVRESAERALAKIQGD
jgi:serine/threonine protein kinase